MASLPHLPTPSRDASLQTDRSLSPGTAGIPEVEENGAENYFQSINDHDIHDSENVAPSSSTIGPENLGPTEQLMSCLGTLQTSSDVTSLSPQISSVSVTHSSSNITSCALTTEISSSDPSDCGALSSSATPSHTKSAPKTPSPQLLPALDAVPSPSSAETQVQSTDHVSSSCFDQPLEKFEATSYLSNHQKSNLELLGGSSEVSHQAIATNSEQGDAEEPGKYIKQDKMDSISDVEIPGDDIHEPYYISNPLSLSNSGIDSKVPVEDDVTVVPPEESLKSINTVSGLLSTEAPLDMPSASEMPPRVSDVSINQEEVQHTQSDPSDLNPATEPRAKLGGSEDDMPVLYLQVTKNVQEKTQRTSHTIQSQDRVVFSALIPHESRFRPSETLDIATHLPDKQNVHEEQGHNELGKNLKNPPVVLSSATEEQRNSKKASSAAGKIRQPISPGPLGSALETQKTPWTPGATYSSYYPAYWNTDPRFSDNYSLHYSRAQHAWVDLKGHRSQRESKVQFRDQNNQKQESQLKQLEKSHSDHVPNSDQLTSRQKRPKARTAVTDQNKTSQYWSENYAKHYDSQGWNSQGYYPTAYYHGYYYPYGSGYQAEGSTSNSHQYHTKPDSYDDWWRYYPGFDSTFDHGQYSQYQQSYWDQWDRQSSHSGYSTQSMPSTHSHHSRTSWHSEQSWGYPSLQYTDCPTHDVSVQSPVHSDTHGLLEREARNEDCSAACSSGNPSILEHFSFPHCCARFGPGGQLIQVLPNLPSEGKPALVQIYNTEIMLQDCWGQPELQTFPGPLIKDKTHKTEVLEFVRRKYQECLQNDTPADKEASCLLWELMELVCKQNGKLVGTDISHLLIRNQRSASSSKNATSDLIDFTSEAQSRTLVNQTCDAESITEDTVWTMPEDTEMALQCFRELLIFGKKKDALETAINRGLWGHAFMLASKMDSRACSEVMSKFIDSLPEKDTLRTFYQLMSGRIPSSATFNERFLQHCGTEEGDNWCNHLAMILSNHTRFKHLHKKTITSMGDALASKGCSGAASFCYMVVQLDVDTKSNKSDIFLFGTSSSLPHLKNPTNEAIQLTELFEYALSLGSDSVHLPNFQIFKFIYACRLAEAGLCAQAYQYCEEIAKALLASVSEQSLTLISQLIELSAKMRYFDQQLKDMPEPELSSEPEWLQSLRKLYCKMTEEPNSPVSKQQDTKCLPIIEMDCKGNSPESMTRAECDSTYKISLLTTGMPNKEGGIQEVHLLPPAPQGILENRAKAALPIASQVLDPACFDLSNKAVPLSTISKKSPNLESLNFSPAEEPVEAVKPQAVSEPQLHTLPTTAVLLPEKLVHTYDAHYLPEDQPNEAKESAPTLALPLPAPPTLQSVCPVTTVSTIVQSQYTEDLQSQFHNSFPKSTQVTTEPLTPPSTTSSYSMSLATESESALQLTAPHLETHPLPSATLSSFGSLATESAAVPQLCASHTEPDTLPSTSLATESGAAWPVIAPYIEPHTSSSTALLSSTTVATESHSLSQLSAYSKEPLTLPSITLPSSMSLTTELVSVPQLTVPLPFPPYLDQMGQHYQTQKPITQTSVVEAAHPMASPGNYWGANQNLCAQAPQVPSKSTSMICPPLDPQPLHPAVSNGELQPTYTVNSQPVPLLTVPLSESHVLDPNISDHSANQTQHVAQMDSKPPQTSCPRADPMLGQKPFPPSSANPYAMGEKMAHSKQTHMLSNPVMPKLFVPQSPPPDPQPKKKEAGDGWFSWLFGKKKEAQLPADTGKSLVWDENLQEWVDSIEAKEKNKSGLERSKGVLKTTTASSGDFEGPRTKELLSAMPVLRPGPKRGYMAPLNPVLMSNNPGTQLYASEGISSTEARVAKPDSTHLTDSAVSGQSTGVGYMRWTQNSQPVPYSQTTQSQAQNPPSAGNVALYNPSHQFSQNSCAGNSLEPRDVKMQCYYAMEGPDPEEGNTGF